MEREPCPQRIWNDLGAAFMMGNFGGFLWHMIRKTREAAPIDTKTGFHFVRLKSAITKSHLTATSFGVWGGLFSTCDCTITYIRKTEDPWNAISAGFATNALLTWRQGAVAAFKAGLVGAMILGIIEGMSFVLGRAITAGDPAMLQPSQGVPAPPNYSPGGYSPPGFGSGSDR